MFRKKVCEQVLQCLSNMTNGPEFFRNSGLGDTFEYLGIWKYSSNFQPRSETSDVMIDKDMGEIEQQVSFERTVERSLSRTSNSNLNQVEHGDTPAVEGDSSSSSESSDEKLNGAEHDPFLVDWNGPKDPENPQNWSNGRVGWHIGVIMLLTCVTYAGASIYTAGQQAFQEEMKIGHVAATLPLSMYVLGYGFGPIVFSPLSEVAVIGRNHIYLVTLFLFTIFQIGCALTPNLGGMVVLRFITGVLCSPSLATGGASLGDIISQEKMPLAIGAWAAGAVAAPVLAPLLGAAMYVAVDWRFIFWFLMMCAGFTFVLMYFFFMETYGPNILHRRAKRIRQETGDNRYYTLQEKLDREISTKEYVKELTLRPFLIQFSEPGVLAFNLYIALGYGAFYLFFEAFPIVFVGIYNFTIVELGLAFLGFQVGCVIAFFTLILFLMKVIVPAFKNNTFKPETFLKLPMMVSWLLPFALFFFGWTAQIHWILPIISEIFFVCAMYNIFQGAFAYLSLSYPRYIASVFASNGFMRSVFAFSFPLFGQAMFNNLGSKKYPVGWGSTLIGFFTVGLAAIPFIFYAIGPKLRGKSKYAN